MPFTRSEAVQLYCEKEGAEERHVAIFAYSGTENSAAFEFVELDGS